MRRLVPLASVLLLVALLATSAPASAVRVESATAQGNTYRTYAACSTHPAAPPSHRCPRSGTKGAFFKNLDAHVRYKVCVRFPNDERLCAPRQDAPEDELRINPITSHRVGEHLVTWFVAGDKVDTFRFRIHA